MKNQEENPKIASILKMMELHANRSLSRNYETFQVQAIEKNIALLSHENIVLELYNKIKNFLPLILVEQKYSVEQNIDFCYEESKGQYEVPTLNITVHQQNIIFKPVASFYHTPLKKISAKGPGGQGFLVLQEQNNSNHLPWKIQMQDSLQMYNLEPWNYLSFKKLWQKISAA